MQTTFKCQVSYNTFSLTGRECDPGEATHDPIHDPTAMYIQAVLNGFRFFSHKKVGIKSDNNGFMEGNWREENEGCA